MTEVLGRAETAVEDRQVAELIGKAEKLHASLREANNNLQSISRRLFTQPNEPPSDAIQPDVPEPVRSELEQLRYLLGRVDSEISRTFELSKELDRI